jgi:[acyl-carrier-protein] S-malonyltransferase
MLAVVFPGQGAQQVGMSADFAERFPEACEVFEAVDDAFEGPLSRWIREGPRDRLARTEVTQPAVLAASVAAYRVLESRLPARPTLLAGHSLGEYTALVAAGALELHDAVRLVRLRGALMQEAVPEGKGAMVAVLGLATERVEEICAEVEGAYPANFNAPGQTVVSGDREGVEAAAERLLEAGARRVIPLEVSAPFHCPLMAPARDKLAPALAAAPLRDLEIPVVSNVTALPYRTAEEARRLLGEQVCAPVRWVDTVRTLVRSGVTIQLEVGPGHVLTGLAGRTERGLLRSRVSQADEIEPALAEIAEALS